MVRGHDGENYDSAVGILSAPWRGRVGRFFLTGFPTPQVKGSFANKEKRNDSRALGVALIRLDARNAGKRVNRLRHLGLCCLYTRGPLWTNSVQRIFHRETIQPIHQKTRGWRILVVWGVRLSSHKCRSLIATLFVRQRRVHGGRYAATNCCITSGLRVRSPLLQT